MNNGYSSDLEANLIATLPPERRYLCFKPARTCCCGCTLQAAIYVMAGIELITAFFALTALITSGSISSLFDVIVSGFFGFVAWRAAAKLHPQSALWFNIYRQVLLVCSCISCLVLSCLVLFGWKVMQKVLQHDIDEIVHSASSSSPMTPEEQAKLARKVMQAIVYSILSGLVLESVVAFFFGYIAWSFKERLNRLEISTITTGSPAPAGSAPGALRVGPIGGAYPAGLPVWETHQTSGTPMTHPSEAQGGGGHPMQPPQDNASHHTENGYPPTGGYKSPGGGYNTSPSAPTHD